MDRGYRADWGFISSAEPTDNGTCPDAEKGWLALLRTERARKHIDVSEAIAKDAR